MEIMEDDNLKPGDRVKIISAPVVDNNWPGQMRINSTVGKTGRIMKIFKNGVRNITISFDDFDYNNYNSENLKKV